MREKTANCKVIDCLPTVRPHIVLKRIQVARISFNSVRRRVPFPQYPQELIDSFLNDCSLGVLRHSFQSTRHEDVAILDNSCCFRVSVADPLTSPSHADDVSDTHSSADPVRDAYRPASLKYLRDPESFVPCASPRHSQPCAWRSYAAACGDWHVGQRSAMPFGPSATHAAESSCARHVPQTRTPNSSDLPVSGVNRANIARLPLARTSPTGQCAPCLLCLAPIHNQIPVSNLPI